MHCHHLQQRYRLPEHNLPKHQRQTPGAGSGCFCSLSPGPSMRNDPVPARRHAPRGSALLKMPLRWSAGLSATTAADSKHNAASGVFSSACGCRSRRSSANHTPRSRGILAALPLPRPPSALRRKTRSASIRPNRAGTPHAGAAPAPRLRLAPGHDKRSLARSGASHSPLINGSRPMTGFFAWPPIGR